MKGPNQDQSGSDGIGDTPYTNIGGGSDKYPLMAPIDGTQYSISLQQGWNLISVPLIQANESISKVLTSIPSKWDVIQAYNSVEINWKTNATFKPDQLNDLKTLNHSIGFWINITQPGITLTVYGFVPTSTSIPLKAGWNLVGYPSLVQKPISEALAGTGYDSVEGFNASDPYRTSVLPGSYLMKPGEGYWVHVPADSTWVVNW
jgi:hypothetical protein